MNIDTKVPVAKYELVTGVLIGDSLVKPLLAGFAVQFADENHYVIRLAMFPNNPYYLCKNRDSQSEYTAFGKIVKDGAAHKSRFQNPIGSGKLLTQLKSHLEIRFPLLNCSVFMNLYPRQ